jgi:hypothetical protein
MKKSEEQNIEHIIKRMLADTSVDAPQDEIKYARNLYRTRAAEPKASVIQRVLAVMQVDLAPNRAAFGERSATGAQARQLLFDAGKNAVDLRITAVKNGFDIRGQILGDGFENGGIEVTDDETSFNAKIDKTSGFSFSVPSAGKYDLTIRGNNGEIVIEKVKIT